MSVINGPSHSGLSSNKNAQKQQAPIVMNISSRNNKMAVACLGKHTPRVAKTILYLQAAEAIGAKGDS